MVRRREDGRKGARAVALYGLLIALAFIFSYVEAMIPVPVPIPGVKLGAGAVRTGGHGGGWRTDAG